MRSYSFEIKPADYLAMGWHLAGGWAALFRTSAVRGLVLLLLLGCVHVLAQPVSARDSFLFAIGVPLGYALAAPLWLRWLWSRKTISSYESEPYIRMFGPHTLEFDEEGIRSRGPVHETFRRWAAITSFIVTPTHVLMPTVFGNVYTIPRSAIGDLESLREFAEERIRVASATTA